MSSQQLDSKVQIQARVKKGFKLLFHVKVCVFKVSKIRFQVNASEIRIFFICV